MNKLSELDQFDEKLLALLQVNARLPVVTLAKSLACARSTVQARLKALEDKEIITAYTVRTSLNNRQQRGIQANVMISIDSKQEAGVLTALKKRFEINRLYSVSGRYDLCAMIETESTQELDRLIDKIRAINGVLETFSMILLAKKFDRAE